MTYQNRSNTGFTAAGCFGTAAIAAFVVLAGSTAPAAADCLPQASAGPGVTPAPGTTVTCSGVTTQQNGNNGYGTGDQNGLTINVLAGASVIGNAFGPNSSGISVNTDNTINNAGSIDSASNGILTAGSVVLNNTGQIGGFFWSVNAGATATIVNSGTMSGTISGAVLARTDANITNTASGTMSSFGRTIRAIDQITLNNAGSITSDFDEVVLATSGAITNTGTIAGDGGVRFSDGPSTVFNSGTITGRNAPAITFGGSGNTLTLGPGSVINGDVLGAGADTFQLGGEGSGTFDAAALGVQYTGFSTFNKVGSSLWTLSGIGSQTWNVSGGTLAGTNASQGNVVLSNNAVFDFNQTTSGVYTGVVSGVGTLAKDGTGTVTLASMQTYSGGTAINAGALTMGIGNALPASTAVSIGAPGTLNLAGFDLTIGSLAGAAGSTVQLGSGTLTTGGNNTSTVFAGVVAGAGGLTKVGTGTFALDGSNTYSGATTVNGGTLSVNGSIASSSITTVNAGGTLAGNGFVGNTLINGGTLSPGNSVGTLNVVGNLVFTAASRYLVEVTAANADRVNVSGTATLGGATVNASFAPGSSVTRRYNIVNATGGVIGTFGALVNTNLPSNFASALSYDANNAYLDLTLSFTSPSGPLNANQQQVADALTGYFNRTGGIPMAFSALNAQGLTLASGETATGSQQATFDAMNLFLGLLTDPFSSNRDAGWPGAVNYADEALNYTSKRKPADALAAIYRKAPPMAPVFEPRWNVWAAGFGGQGTTDGNAATGSNTATSRIFAGAVGADYWLSPATVAGFGIAGGGTNFSVNGAGSGRSDLFQAGGFVRHTAASAYITAAAAYGWQDISTERSFGGGLQARYNANSYSGRTEAGNRFVAPWFGGIALTPYAAGQVTAFDLPAYAESAGLNPFALSYGGKTVTATRSELGLRSDRAFAINDAVLTLRGRAAWAHDFNTERSLAATFLSLRGASFVVNGARPASDAALTTAAAELSFYNGMSLAATFEGEFSEVTRSYAGKGVVRYQW